MPWILISILILLILLGFWAIWVRKKSKRPIDYYYNFFIVGIIWTAFGIPLKNYALSGMGIVFLIVGLVNKNKWKENTIGWNDLTEEEKRMKLFIMIILSFFVFVGFVLWLFAEKRIL
ncbi:hypothetical protein ACFLZ0_01935 [Patescibacteria group bacterium]